MTLKKARQPQSTTQHPRLYQGSTLRLQQRSLNIGLGPHLLIAAVLVNELPLSLAFAMGGSEPNLT